MSVLISVDPGFSGAIVLLHSDGKLIDVYDTPTDTEPYKKKTRIIFDKAGILKILAYHPWHAEYAFIEDVGARPGQGVTSMFRFGYGLGLFEGMLSALKIECHKVLPEVWKTEFNLIGKDKNESINVARQLFPSAPLTLKKHHGRAEALCIAEYGRRKLFGAK